MARDKLPKHLSYPIGARALTVLVDTAPQFDALSVDFRSRYVTPERQEPYAILMASYRHEPNGQAHIPAHGGNGHNGACWELDVYPVAYEKRKVARQLLCGQGVPRILKWLHAPRTSDWRSGRHWCRVMFDPSDESISIRTDENGD